MTTVPTQKHLPEQPAYTHGIVIQLHTHFICP